MGFVLFCFFFCSTVVAYCMCMGFINKSSKNSTLYFSVVINIIIIIIIIVTMIVRLINICIYIYIYFCFLFFKAYKSDDRNGLLFLILFSFRTSNGLFNTGKYFILSNPYQGLSDGDRFWGAVTNPTASARINNDIQTYSSRHRVCNQKPKFRWRNWNSACEKKNGMYIIRVGDVCDLARLRGRCSNRGGDLLVLLERR